MEENQEAATVVEQPKGKSRFVWGMALGALSGVLVAVLILAITALVIYFDMRAQMNPYYRSGSSKVTYVQSSQAWVSMKDAKRGQVAGRLDGGWGSSSDLGYGAVADFTLGKLTRQDDVPAKVVIHILVTPKTTLTMGGKPWSPKDADRKKSPAEMLFSDDGGDESTYDFLEERELTVSFRREGDAVIAENIDASSERTMPEELLDF